MEVDMDRFAEDLLADGIHILSTSAGDLIVDEADQE